MPLLRKKRSGATQHFSFSTHRSLSDRRFKSHSLMPAGSNKEPPPSSTEPDNGQDSSNNDSKNLTPLVKHFLAYRTINARDWDEWCLRRCAKPSRPEHEADCSRLCLRRTWATSAQEKDKDTQIAQLRGEQATQYRSWNPLKGYSIVSGPYPVKGKLN